ncbi:retinoschisin-like [Actinia tenebrosa]|uniref:Retinoschisin-like n=1 Tax=Actinia tenebrosa TaxID=6105 RepID=A0A6P8J1V4_ACTTE|nr:retinoschisin-like [Actinia tenebrosa]
MKYFLAIFLFIFQVKLSLLQMPADNDAALEKRVAAVKDLLSNASCLYIKKNGYCKFSFIQNMLCYIKCHCDDILSQRSCNIIKTKNKCNSSWSAYFCKLTCDHCSRYNASCTTSNPLGMKSGAIPDSSITASSIYNKYYYPARARLDAMKETHKRGAWAPKTNNISEWLQVDLGHVTKVTHIATQGNKDIDEWVKSYSIQYSFDGQHFFDYEAGKIFAGNVDHSTIVKHAFIPPIVSRYIRVRPKTMHKHIAMRMELYGCR